MANDYYKPVSDFGQGGGDSGSSRSSVVGSDTNSDTNQTADAPAASPPQPPETPQPQAVSDTPSGDQTANFVAEQVEAVVADLGLEGATDEQKKKILETIDKRVETAIVKALIEKASDEQAAKLKDAIDQNGPIEDVVEQIVTEDPELRQEIEGAMAELYNKIKGEISQLSVVSSQEQEEGDSQESVGGSQSQENNGQELGVGSQEQENTENQTDEVETPTESDSGPEMQAPAEETTLEVPPAIAPTVAPQIEPAPEIEAKDETPTPAPVPTNLLDKKQLIQDILASGEQVGQSTIAAQIFKTRMDKGIGVPEIDAVPDPIERSKRYQNWDWDQAGIILGEFQNHQL